MMTRIRTRRALPKVGRRRLQLARWLGLTLHTTTSTVYPKGCAITLDLNLLLLPKTRAIYPLARSIRMKGERDLRLRSRSRHV